MGTYGTFTIGAAGTWVYRLDNEDPDTGALAAGQVVTDTFDVLTIDGTRMQVAIFVTGADEPVTGADDGNATIGGTTTGSVTEDDPDGSAVSGTLTIVDADADESWFRTLGDMTTGVVGAGAYSTHAATRRQIEGVYGTFTLTADGNWTYTLDEQRPATDRLAQGTTRREVFTVYSADGTAAQVVITVTGANDPAVVAGDRTGAVTEDSPAATVAGGTLTVSDPDAGGEGFRSQSAAPGTYGTFTLGAGGEWSYTLDNARAATNALTAAQTPTDTFEVFTADGTRVVVTITVTGADEATAPVAGNATIGGTTTGEVTEDDPDNTEATGTLTVSDPEEGEAKFRAQAATRGTYGTFTLGADGEWSYTLDNANANTDALLAGQTRTETFSTVTTDGTRTQVTITVTGASEPAVLIRGSESQSLAVTLIEEDDGTRRIRVVDRNDNNTVVSEDVLGDVTNVTIRTGDGADTVTIDSDSFVTILEGEEFLQLPTLTLDTGLGRDRLVVDSAPTALVQWRLDEEGTGWIYGTLNDDARTEILFVTFSGIEDLQGGKGRDTLVGPNRKNTWKITGQEAGTVGAYAFSQFEVIVGGSESDHLSGPAADTSWYVTGTGAGNVGGYMLSFAGIESIAGSGSSDVLHGPSANTVWHLDALNAGKVAGIAFSGMENLSGSDGNQDQFVLGKKAGLTGSIKGGADGFDTLFFDKTKFSSSTVTRDPDEAGKGTVTLDGTVIRYSGMETPGITVGGTRTHRVLTATDSRDELVLRWSEDGTRLVLDSINGAMEDVSFRHPTGSLTIELGGGSDTLTIRGFGDGRGASLTVRGGSQYHWNGVDTIIVAAGALISTRMLADPNGDHMTAFSTGDSGDVILDAEMVHVRPGARILTHVVAGSLKPDGTTTPEAGDITLGDGDGGDLGLDTTKTREVTIESKTVATFDPSSTVNSNNDTIEFGSAHGLTTGAAVRYFTNGGDANRSSRGRRNLLRHRRFGLHCQARRGIFAGALG